MKPLQAKREPGSSPADKLPRGATFHFLGNRLSAFLQASLVAALATLPSASWGEPIGRLFFTPDERSNLDRARLTGGIAERQESALARQPESLTLNGLVKRSSGKTTVWINKLAQNETDLPPSSKNHASKSLQADFPVPVQKTGKTVTLKVGQTLNVDSGEIREIYQPPPRKEAPSASAAKTPGAEAIGAPPLDRS